MKEFALSSILRDTLTGYQGAATAKVRDLNGTVQYCLVRPMGDDGVYPKGTYIDWQRLEELEGPTIDIPRHCAPFDLGDLLRDKITGLQGIATQKVDYVNGCVHYGITPKKEKKEIKQPETEYVDSACLELVKANAVNIKAEETGCDQAPSSSGLSYS